LPGRYEYAREGTRNGVEAAAVSRNIIGVDYRPVTRGRFNNYREYAVRPNIKSFRSRFGGGGVWASAFESVRYRVESVVQLGMAGRLLCGRASGKRDENQ
jgi:hypothetical protein